MLDRGQLVPGPGGRLWMDGAIFDITERRAAEEALRRREIEAARTEELRASRVRIVAGGRRRAAQDRARPARRRAAAPRVARARGARSRARRSRRTRTTAGPFLERLGDELDGGVGRAARARPRHPPGRADRARPRAGDRRARRRARRCPSRSSTLPGERLPPRGRGDRVLHGRRGADERREVRRGERTRPSASRARTADLVVEVRDDGIGGARRRRRLGPERASPTASARSTASLSVESPPGAGHARARGAAARGRATLSRDAVCTGAGGARRDGPRDLGGQKR